MTKHGGIERQREEEEEEEKCNRDINNGFLYFIPVSLHSNALSVLIM